MSKPSKTAKKLTSGFITILVLAACLCLTTFALAYSTLVVDNNLFQTGEVTINLNDGKPVIEDGAFLFEPGMTVEKDFFLENQSTWDVYYKLYLDNVEGGLADLLDVSIRSGDTVLFSGKASALTEDRAVPAEDVLRLHERRELAISFHFPEDAGNRAQNLYMSFTLKADAVQTKNNPNRLFD